MGIGAGIDQLHGDAHLVAGFAHAAFDDVFDLEHLADGAQVLVPALEIERGGATPDLEVRDPGQGIQQFFGDTVGEVLLVLVRAHIGKRQDSDGLFRGSCCPDVSRCSGC